MCLKCGYKWLGGWDNENDRQEAVPFYCPHCKNVRWNQEYTEEEDKLFEELYKEHIVKETLEESEWKKSYPSRFTNGPTNRIAHLDFIAFCFFYAIRPQPDFFELKQIDGIPKQNIEKRHELMLSIIYDRIDNADRYKHERYSKIIGKNNDGYSFYYKYGKKTTYSWQNNDKNEYDFRRAVMPSEQSKECKHADHYDKLKDMITRTQKLRQDNE